MNKQSGASTVATASSFSRSVLVLLSIALSPWAGAQTLSSAPGTSGDASTNGRSDTSSELTEITVTATRRELTAQSIPIAITAIGSGELAALGVSSPADLTQVVPNLEVSMGYGSGQARFSMRGLGVSDYSLEAVSTVGLYLDDVYQAYTFGIGTSLFDLNRVEALRGPQGTLFGKNTTGGAIAYFAAPPTDQFGGYTNVEGGGGQFQHYAAEGVLNAPISDVLLSRLSFRMTERDDYVENLTNGSSLGHRSDYNARFQLQWTPGANTVVNLKTFGAYASGDGTIYHGFYLSDVCNPGLGVGAYFNCKSGAPAPAPLSASEVYSYVPPSEIYQNYGATLRIDQHLAGDYALTSITGYANVKYQGRTNDTGTSADFFHSIQQMSLWQGSQEVRLATPVNRPVSAVVGVFAMYDSFVSPNTSISTEPGVPYDYAQVETTDQDTTTYAIFASTTWHFADQWSIIGGVRDSSERKKINLMGLDMNSGTFNLTNYNVSVPGGITNNTLLAMDPLHPPFPIYTNIGPYSDILFSQNESNTYKKVTWDATLNYQPTENALLYTKVSTGFRSGGYNTYATLVTSVATVQPETVKVYEAGAKTEWLNRRLRLNGDIFYYDYTNQQVQSIVGSTAGTRLSNAGASIIKGAELELEAVPVPAALLSASAGFTDARYTTFLNSLNGQPISLAGNYLPYAPRFTASALGRYTWQLGNAKAFAAQTSWSYRSTVYYDPFNLPYTSDGTLILGNVRFTLDMSPTSSVYLYSDNIGNRRYTSFSYYIAGLNAAETYADRRTIGVGLRYRF